MGARVRKAVFPVGGMGTRFLPATKALPKEMLPVVDKPLIQYAVEEAAAAGIEEFIFVTGRGKAAIEDHFDHSFELQSMLDQRGKSDMLQVATSMLPTAGTIAYTRQLEPLGLGHAVWCARHLVGDEPFAILLADDLILSQTPCLKQMVDAQARQGGNMIAVMDVPEQHTDRYGILSPGFAHENLIEVKGLVEKPKPDAAPSNKAVIGRYILQPEIFELLEKQEPGAGNEIQLTDSMAALVGRQPFFGLRFEGERFDCGDKLGFLQATIAYALARDDMGEGLKTYLRDLAPTL
ncbi:MAG: UTP--glucose-1-phosphate uridylyltransferase GalU [Minwuia sp.]|uniref:UTP--glucose-1-phosphate uridylyltransferase GalU n=1 Tax=Minwuia sp. TaxID=2493630 RepID=UPI003A8A849A